MQQMMTLERLKPFGERNAKLHGLVKGQSFHAAQYAGESLWAIRIFRGLTVKLVVRQVHYAVKAPRLFDKLLHAYESGRAYRTQYEQR